MKKETLYKFFNGKASLEEKMQIREWMEASPENEEILIKDRKFFDYVSLLVSERKANKKTDRQNTFFPELLKIASVILLTIGIGYLYIQYDESRLSIATQTIHVPSGQRVNMQLPDGTNVWLNARSDIRYPVSFGKKERVVELNGEAYFEVAENKEIPFVVKTIKGEVEVLGTDFNVESYNDRDDFETTLIKGRVIVRSADKQETVVLAPDHKAVLQHGKFNVEKVDDYTAYRWIEGLICFNNEPFESITEDFEKYYGITVEVENPKIREYTYTGKFRHTDGIDYALRVLQKYIRFTYSRDDEKQIIYIK
ncbi:MAG: FecR family protein [Tannerella sp.]|jgi:ferric-dicitrate binding protein FerR (iron transport regulator)|nr:FecR family protein [Tannerella sp.]